MLWRQRSQKILLLMLVTGLWFAGDVRAGAADSGPTLKAAKLKNAKVGGKWRMAWDVRLGTVRGVLAFKQHADRVEGTFQEYGKTYLLSGTVQGRDITFQIPFPGPAPYTIEFKGSVERDKITGTSALAGGGRGFLGHAGEVEEPQHPWTATKGLKHDNTTPDKPPKDDDD
jgi:hypothetical protein